jgi:hypothetical protein
MRRTDLSVTLGFAATTLRARVIARLTASACWRDRKAAPAAWWDELVFPLPLSMEMPSFWIL